LDVHICVHKKSQRAKALEWLASYSGTETYEYSQYDKIQQLPFYLLLFFSWLHNNLNNEIINLTIIIIFTFSLHRFNKKYKKKRREKITKKQNEIKKKWWIIDEKSLQNCI
jgi:hypothetical protein